MTHSTHSFVGSNHHGMLPQPELEFQYQRANALDQEREQEEKETTEQEDNDDVKQPPKTSCSTRTMQVEDEPLCRQLYRLFEGHVGQIAQVLRVSQESVQDYIQRERLELPKNTSLVLPPKLLQSGGKGNYQAPSNYNPIWYQNISKALRYNDDLPDSMKVDAS